MIDVIDPSSSSKYGDTAESSGDPGEPPSTALSQTAVTITATATSTPTSTASIDITDNHHLRSIATAARLIANETQLRARGRGLALELDDDGIPIDEDVEEAEEVDDVEEVDLDTTSAFQAVTHPGPGSPLKASLLDYVLSEVARNSSGMDLEHMNVQVAPRRISSRRYAFNPEESQDCPPHLSEYFERNVIAVLNRCDPMTWGRCLSCGNPPAGDVGTTNNEVISCNNNNKNGGNVVTVTAAGSSDVDVDTPVQVWNYYNYKSDYRTNGYLGGNGNQAYQYHSEPTSPFQASSAPPHHHQFFPDAGTGSGERMRCGSDDGGGGASGGNGVVATQNDLEQSNAAGQTNMMEDEEVFTFDARLLSEAFLSSGRVDHTIQLMAYHPDYLEIFLRTHHFLMRGDGPLPYNFRNYIAIMAAARYRCSYLMELQKREFLYQGGDPNWLRGLDCAPPKLTALYNINKVMAHRPWVLKKEDLQHLTKKAGWSLSEVVQAVVILAHFHSLSSFIHGCGITPELDFDNGHTFLLDPATMGGSSGRRSTTPDISSDAGKVFHSHSHHHHPHQHQHHHLVSFALDNPAGPVPCSSTPGGNSSGVGGSGATKQTKSILKKTDVCSSNTNNHNNNNSATSGSINVINVPTAVHFHPYHHPQHQQQHFSASSVPSSLNSSPTQNSSLLKSDTLHNSLCGNLVGSPPRGAGGKILLGGVAPSSSVSEVDIIMATMKNLSETSPIEDPEEKKKRFETVARSDVDNQDQKENLQKGQVGQVGGHHVSMLPPDVTPFISEPDFTYEDFAKRGQISELHTFRIQDYSWEEHGYSLVNRLYAEVGQILDDKFKVAQSMTYYTIGGRANVDTTKFRTAVWNYIQCLYGIRHDDYDYGEVNQLLERPLKTFIKTVCCYPERITKADYDNVMREFKHSEKVHVNLMIMEAKLQAELLYALRTVMKLMF